MGDQNEETPDAVAKKFFIITISTLALYVLSVVIFVL